MGWFRSRLIAFPSQELIFCEWVRPRGHFLCPEEHPRLTHRDCSNFLRGCMSCSHTVSMIVRYSDTRNTVNQTVPVLLSSGIMHEPFIPTLLLPTRGGSHYSMNISHPAYWEDTRPPTARSVVLLTTLH